MFLSQYTTKGYSRDSYYRFQELYKKAGEGALLDMCTRKAVVANRVRSCREKNNIRYGHKVSSIWSVKSV